jgi:hypothetical protein
MASGDWNSGTPPRTVKRIGFTQNYTGTTPAAKAAPPDLAPILLEISTPWYTTPSRVNRIAKDPKQRSTTGGMA